MIFRKEPADPLGDGNLEIWQRNLKAWIRAHLLHNIVGMKRVEHPSGGFSYVPNPEKLSGGGSSNANGHITGEWNINRVYHTDDIAVIPESSVVAGSYGYVAATPSSGSLPWVGDGKWIKL